MSRFLMRDEDGNICPRCGGTGVIRSLTMSPADNEPCDCTYADDDEDEIAA